MRTLEEAQTMCSKRLGHDKGLCRIQVESSDHYKRKYEFSMICKKLRRKEE